MANVSAENAIAPLANILGIIVNTKDHVKHFVAVSNCYARSPFSSKVDTHLQSIHFFLKDLGDVWSIRTFGYASLNQNISNANEFIIAYDRPTYKYESGIASFPEGELRLLMYTGSRWFVMNMTGKVMLISSA